MLGLSLWSIADSGSLGWGCLTWIIDEPNRAELIKFKSQLCTLLLPNAEQLLASGFISRLLEWGRGNGLLSIHVGSHTNPL